jgi:hypothetical protein
MLSSSRARTASSSNRLRIFGWFCARALCLGRQAGMGCESAVIASEAKQSISPSKERMDCFVAEPVIGRAFARPVGSSQRRLDTPPLSRDAMRPSYCKKSLTPNKGRGECRVPDAPAAARVESNTRVSHHGYTGSPGIPARNGFNGFLRALPGDRALLSPSPGGVTPRNLTPASGRQDHTTSPSASGALVRSAISVHRIPCPTSVTIAKRPSVWAGITGL